MNVLIVDRDLGFAFWLGRALEAAKIPAFPAKTVSDACELISQLDLHVDVLVLDWTLPGAQELISSLRRATRLCVITILMDANALPPASFPYDAVGVRPRHPHGDRDRERDRWVRLVATRPV